MNPFAIIAFLAGQVAARDDQMQIMGQKIMELNSKIEELTAASKTGEGSTETTKKAKE